ncbi:tripartite tricarboxylate transporter TctB family protein [Treponema zioleckii]|uniref:tripartite tricarboxylate transporter TctB family protein n=1 Tax=Treponema zioleckii TaxID=331680 RepID=UPI00168C0C76|nr:tripartite tricarboxylate transporter TctB family protein [Treponema zioleckii]
MKKANIIASIIGMGISGFAFGYTFTFKKFKNVPVGPEFFPRALAVALFICCFILFIQNIILLIKSKKSNQADSKAPTLSLKDKGIQKALLSLALIVVYVILWNYLGFLLTTPFVIFAMICLLGKRTYFVNAIFAVGATVVIFAIFKFLLGITMPLGFMEGLF